MSNDNVLMIAVMDIRPEIAGETDLMERLRKAMAKAQDFWMDTDDDLRFRAACAAAMLESPEDEKQRIVDTVAAMRKIGAAIHAASAGASIDMAQTFASIDSSNLLPLREMWDEAKKAA